MQTAIVTANLGNFDKTVPYVKQSVPYDFYKFTDDNFPPRYCSMTPRLQARLVKMFMWEMVPDMIIISGLIFVFASAPRFREVVFGAV